MRRGPSPGVGGDLAQARSYAIRLIKFRARTEKEVRDKLLSRDFEPEIIEQVVAAFLKSRLLDDALFAKLWVQSRIKRPLGISRLRRELSQKGVRREIAEAALDQAMEDYDESAVIRAVIAARSKGMKGVSLDKKRARLFGYLARRGFSRERIMEILFDTL
jgi:regulatory protein